MFIEAADETGSKVVWLFTGATNSDADYQRYCDSITRLKVIPCVTMRVAIVIVDPGNPIPDASWRKTIAEVSADVEPNTALILVGGALARGVATAINWLRPPTYILRTSSTFASAHIIAEELNGAPLPILEELHARARSSIQKVA